jgi:phthiodiolone/phenolphthiodiolone dimycocerosates ketoreductase
MQIPRYVSPRTAGEFAKMLEASGVIDDLMIFDYLVSFNPRSMWMPDITPLANTHKDDDSYHDAFILAAVAASASNLGICIMTDSMRRGPWLSQTMFSLADTTSGQVTLALGAGEARHGKPFGYDRKEGLGRLKDMMRIWNLMLDCDGPFDFDGKYWKLEQTYLGTVRPKRRPKLWALGGGPKLIEYAAQYADGLLTYVPGVWGTAEQCAEVVAGIKKTVASFGRDPDTFEIGIQVGVVLHEDPREVEKALEHPLVKFISALFGRISMKDWVKEGFEPPFPEDWHYANNLFPTTITRAECDSAIGRMTPEMVRKANFVGSPAEVAAQLQKYVDAGVSWVVPSDLSSFCSMDLMGSANRVIELARILKSNK